MKTFSQYFAVLALAAALLGSTGCFFRVDHRGDRDRDRVEGRVDVGVDVRDHRDEGVIRVEPRVEGREERR